jgi:predicted dinucleotide-binding enzyme
MNAYVMVNPALVPGDHNVFLSGNDADAKKQVAAFLTEWFGWRPESIIDLGDITTARGAEMLLPIWIRLFAARRNPFFNFHIAVGAPPQ